MRFVSHTLERRDNMKKSKRILAVTLASALLFCLCLSATSDAAGLKMSKSKLTLYVKKSSSLKLIGAKNKEVTWKSSNKKIATVSVSKSNPAKATVKAKNVGKATITAKCGKKKYTCKVTVKKKVLPSPTPAPVKTEEGYYQISHELAKEMMDRDDGHIVVDVRREDEFKEGHIAGAVLIPSETIITDMPKQLPDLDQIILVYCRSGNRSKSASARLAAIGYTNVYEFGGIKTWHYGIVA